MPEHDYMPLIALLERRLSRWEVKKIAEALRRADVSPAGPSDIAAGHHRVHPHRAERERPAAGARPTGREGWPVEFPDPDLG